MHPVGVVHINSPCLRQFAGFVLCPSAGASTARTVITSFQSSSRGRHFLKRTKRRCSPRTTSTSGDPRGSDGQSQRQPDPVCALKVLGWSHIVAGLRWMWSGGELNSIDGGSSLSSNIPRKKPPLSQSRPAFSSLSPLLSSGECAAIDQKLGPFCSASD